MTSDAGGTLTVTVADVPPAIQPQIDIFDASLGHMASKYATNSGQELLLTKGIDTTADYFIRIRDIGNDNFSTSLYSLIITGARFDYFVPLAFIDSVAPNPLLQGQSLTLEGHGEDKDGTIIGYEWRSSIDGVVSSSRVAELSGLTNGTHTLSFKVKDNDQNWSSETKTLLYVGVSAPREEEPNNELGSASPVTFNLSNAAAISPAGDVDFFKIHVPQAGLLSITSSNPVGSPIRLYLEMFTSDADYAWVSAGAANNGDPVTVQWSITEPGDYYLKITDQNNTTGNYTLTAQFQPVPDPYEQNPDIMHAAAISPNDTVPGYIFPAGAGDWYAVTVDSPGMLSISLTNMPTNLRGYIETWDQNLNYTWQRASANNDGDNVAVNYIITIPGTHFIKITDLDTHVDPANPYTLTTRFFPAPDVYEPNNQLRYSARMKKTPVEAFIFPAQDEDFYVIYAKTPEQLTFTIDSVPANLRLRLEVFNANLEYLWYAAEAETDGQTVTMQYTVPADGFYYLKVRDLDSHYSE